MVVTVAIVAGALFIALPAIRGSAAPAPHFMEEAAAAGIDQVYDGEDAFVGGGVAAFDCDDDGRLDLYLAGGSRPAALYRNGSPIGGPLRFERIADPTTDLTAVTGAYPLDVDGDGQTDLAVLRHGENVILRGLGDCRFERANEALGLAGGDGFTVAFSATWEGDAALPTLAWGDYVIVDTASQSYVCPDGTFVHPAPDGARYDAPTALSPGYCPLSMLFSDWDRSGRRDLRVSNDRHYYGDAGEEQLWRIAPGEAPRGYTRADGWQRLQIFGMGIASQDLTGDGYPEVYLTSQSDNKLQTLADGPAQPTYVDIALKRGVTSHRPFAGDVLLPSTSWDPSFEDVNDDGYLDLFITKGNVGTEGDHAMQDPSDLLLGQPDGTFVEATESAGLLDFAKGRGAAVVDLDGDGLLDIVKMVSRGPVQVWRNLGSAAVPGTGSGGTAGPAAPMGHWLGVVAAQPGPNHDAIGAHVAIRSGDRVVERELTVGGGHGSGALAPVHIGLGGATTAEVRVTWPDGEVGPWLPVSADQVVRVDRGAPAVTPLASSIP